MLIFILADFIQGQITANLCFISQSLLNNLQIHSFGMPAQIFPSIPHSLLPRLILK